MNSEACSAGEECNPTTQACEKATPPDGSISDPGMQDAAADDGSSSGSGPCTWKTVPSGTAADLYGLWGSSATDVWAGGTNGTIAWTNEAPPISAHIGRRREGFSMHPGARCDRADDSTNDKVTRRQTAETSAHPLTRALCETRGVRPPRSRCKLAAYS